MRSSRTTIPWCILGLGRDTRDSQRHDRSSSFQHLLDGTSFASPSFDGSHPPECESEYVHVTPHLGEIKETETALVFFLMKSDRVVLDFLEAIFHIK
jgi:hypothetical protein